MLLDMLWLAVGFVFLVISADKFVYGAAALARNYGLSPMFIGLTIVAMGSSAPEMMVSATASLKGSADTAIGNALGSNITNIALVLGLTALIKPLQVSSSIVNRELPILLLVTIVAVWMLADKQFEFWEGIVLFAGFILFIGVLTWASLRNRNKKDKMLIEAEDEVPSDVPTSKAVFWLVLGMIVLPLSSMLLVDSASNIARYFGISDLMIGLTIIAIGTSLPELAASIASIAKKEHDLALGNIIGSNIFNILSVLSLSAIIAPGSFDAMAADRDSIYMLGLTVLMLIMCFGFRGIKRINRYEGGLLIALFIVYQYMVFKQIAIFG